MKFLSAATDTQGAWGGADIAGGQHAVGDAIRRTERIEHGGLGTSTYRRRLLPEQGVSAADLVPQVSALQSPVVRIEVQCAAQGPQQRRTVFAARTALMLRFPRPEALEIGAIVP